MRFFLDLAFGDYVTTLKVLLIPLKVLGVVQQAEAPAAAAELHSERKERHGEVGSCSL